MPEKKKKKKEKSAMPASVRDLEAHLDGPVLDSFQSMPKARRRRFSEEARVLDSLQRLKIHEDVLNSKDADLRKVLAHSKPTAEEIYQRRRQQLNGAAQEYYQQYGSKATASAAAMRGAGGSAAGSSSASSASASGRSDRKARAPRP
ncbi:hypothetical protein ACN28G_29065 [Micromonospora sp. WMMA1923]|uniref:hypothetical protein n=1 Tax=Micromonospora sp. WMMA1923 TaxID=3404125 RepID=UPI003B932CBA